MKKGFAVMLIMVMATGLLFSGGAAESASKTYTIKVGLAQPESHTYYQAFQQFKQEVESKTNGQVKVNIFANNQLGSEKEMQEAVSLGSLEMTLTGVLVSYEPLLAILELPYLFENRDQIKAFHETTEVLAVAKKLEGKNIKLMAFYENGFRQVTNNRRPINSPADLRGLAMRTPENPAQMETFKQLGSVVTPLPSTELYSALQQGVVDGQENPLQNIVSNKFYEVQKHLAITNHIYNSGYVVMNNSFFNGLPHDFQKIVMDAISASEDWQMSVCAEADEGLLEFLIEEGIQVTYPDIKEFQNAVEPVYDVFIRQYGEEARNLIDRAKSLR